MTASYKRKLEKYSMRNMCVCVDHSKKRAMQHSARLILTHCLLLKTKFILNSTVLKALL